MIRIDENFTADYIFHHLATPKWRKKWIFAKPEQSVKSPSMAEYREINIRGVCGFYRAQIIIDAAQSQTTGLEEF